MDSFILLGFLLLLSGCSVTKEVQSIQEEKNDIKSATSAIKAYREGKKQNDIPEMVVPSVYEEVSIFDGQNITFSAENANLHRVLYSISKIAGVNLIIDKDVRSNIPITLSVQGADLKDVLNIIMQMSGCYYVLSGNILHVKQYMRKQFHVTYVHANSSFSTKLGGDTLSSATSDNSSSKGISGKYSLLYSHKEMDFYDELEKNIKVLLSKKSKTNEMVVENESTNAVSDQITPEDFLNKNESQNKKQGQETRRSYNLSGKAGEYTLNRMNGVLTVYDKYKNVQEIEKFIKNIKKQYNKQILIEAKILEVSLNKTHQLGINWDAIGKSVFSPGDTLSLKHSSGLTGAVAGTMTYNSDNFNALIGAINKNGNIDTLSNPRIKVLNGEAAIISSGKLVPYWEKQIDTTQGTGTSDTQVTYNRRDILDGVTMGVTPSVLDDGRIMLNITPISSSIEGEKSYLDENGKVVATAPVISIKEAGTTIYAKDNDLILIGGLMSTSISKERQEVPLLSKIPLFGSLFQQTDDVSQKKELVILLRIRIVE